MWIWVPKKVKTTSRDIISSLPYDILGQILSFLPTKIVASTTVLSKRWKNVLPLVHNLDFNESMVMYPNRKRETLGYVFVDVVENTLVLLHDSPIKKFSLKWESPVINSFRINHLIRYVLQRGVLELQLSSPLTYTHLMEHNFFFSRTLVKLTLSKGCYYQRHPPPSGVFFPALKSLSLFSAYFSASPYVNLYKSLVASPVLEEVNISDGWVKHVTGLSIQRISINNGFHDQDEDQSSFIIKTPNLVYLDYSSYVALDNVGQFDSLVEARLDLRSWKYLDYPSRRYPPVLAYPLKHTDYWGDHATKVIATIRNVVTLHLSADSLEVFYFCCKSMPEFNNLVKLSFESHKKRGWQVLPLLLKKSPNLETLVIKGLVHEITDQCGDVCVCIHDKKKKSCCLLLCGVKVLKIYEYGGSYKEVKQMRHFMENLKCLEILIVKVQVGKQDKYLRRLSKDLKKLLRKTSSKCEIQYI